MKFMANKAMLTGMLACAIFLTVVFFIMRKSFDTPFLMSEKGAQWINIDRLVILNMQVSGEGIVYRKRFFLEHSPPAATLLVRSFGVTEVTIDGMRFPSKSSKEKWKDTQIIDLSGLAAPGMHEIYIGVFNEKGPAVFLASCDALNIMSDSSWEASFDERVWTNAVPVDKKKDTDLSKHFPRTDMALVALLPLYVPLSLVVFFVTLIYFSPRFHDRVFFRRFIPKASGFRWILLTLWIILAINNILKVPIGVGMDAIYHYDYIRYIINNWRLPLATDGWQMFQSPLYYTVSAILYWPLSHLFDKTTSHLLLRTIPLLCGILQVELAYRASKAVFTQRQDLQIWGTMIGGLLPMNLYISQAVGNEPLAGLLSSIAIVIVFQLLTAESKGTVDKKFLFLGAALGLALLAKVTAVLLIPLCVIFMILALYKRRHPPRFILTKMLMVIGIIVAIAGWYYIRNWIQLGKPFVGGWETSFWWQDPGYRTLTDFISFGRSLSAPIYSSVHGFWDSLYSTLWLDGGISSIARYEIRPPWNYDFMLSGALLSLVPAASILIGLLATVSRSRYQAGSPQMFALSCLVVYISAMLYIYIAVPTFSSAKASYTLGLIPCYAVMSATGLDLLSRNNLMRAAVNACLACWAVAAYCSYFVL